MMGLRSKQAVASSAGIKRKTPTCTRVSTTTPTPVEQSSSTTLIINDGTLNTNMNMTTDAYSRINNGTNSMGRGSQTGWTTCPLCTRDVFTPSLHSIFQPLSSTSSSSSSSCSKKSLKKAKSVKKFALGRGISTHLLQVHSPWKPGKAELARRGRIQRRLEGLVHQIFKLLERFPHYSLIVEQAEDKEVQDSMSCNTDSNDVNSTRQTFISSTPPPMPTEIEQLLLNLYKNGESKDELYHRLLRQELGDNIYHRGISSSSFSLQSSNTTTQEQTKRHTTTIEWTPSQNEIDAWHEQVLIMTKELELQSCSSSSLMNNNTNSSYVEPSNRNKNEESTIETMNKRRKITSSEIITITNGTTKENTSKTTANTISYSNRDSFIQPGLDRNGIKVTSYRNSLPPFLKAAANGELHELKRMVHDCKILSMSVDGKDDDCGNDDGHCTTTNAATSKENVEIKKLLHTQDRNGSIAEHWAAGGGHLDCLKYLMELRSNYSLQDDSCADPSSSSSSSSSTTITTTESQTKLRRRDGKVSLHYAARNGHNHIIDYIMNETLSPSSSSFNNNNKNNTSKEGNSSTTLIDIASGDGTTPLHLACYGGSFSTIQHLVERYNADIYCRNEWNCGIGHFVAMTLQSDVNQIKDTLNFIKDSIRQRHEHSIDGASTTTTAETATTTITTSSSRPSSAPSSAIIFGSIQKQGHTALHKAAQKLNGHVIEWIMNEAVKEWSKDEIAIAGSIDPGGKRPSDIWEIFGGDESFAIRMRNQCGW